MRKTLLAAAAIALLAAGPAAAQYAVNDAQLNMQAGQTNVALDKTNSTLGQTNQRLDKVIEVLNTVAAQLAETANNTASSLDQAQRTAQAVGDPREKASRREIRQKWVIGGQGYGRVASAADSTRPVGSSWALRLNQPRGDGSDVRPSIDVLSDPGLAARYSRQAYSVSGVEETQSARVRIEARRKSELYSSTYDAHGMALHSIFATSGTHRRADRLLTIADEAYEAGLADQLFVLNMSIVAMLEEQASLRGLIGQQVRMAAAAQMSQTPAYGASTPNMSAAGTNSDMVYEFGADGSASAATDPGASSGNLTGAPSVSRNVVSRGANDTGNWSYLQAIDYATQPGDYASSLGGMAGLGCPYSTMFGARGSGCSQSVARLLLGELGVSGQSGRTIMSVISGGLSARNLGIQGTTLDMRSVANMLGIGGLMSCFGGDPSTCNYSCQRLATEQMPGGRCDARVTSSQGGIGGYASEWNALDPSTWGSTSNSSPSGRGFAGYCEQLAYSCQNEGRSLSSIPGLSQILGSFTSP